MEPTEAINAVEVAFRELITLVWGTSWPAKTGWDMDKLQGKLETERSMRRGAAVSSNLLDYAEFTQLTGTILKHWPDFAPALGKQKYTGIYIERIENLRNSPMHSRKLLPFERELLSGIVGEIRNLIAIFRSSRGPDMEHYPVIDNVVDGLGHVLTVTFTASVVARLNVGDEIVFQCSGQDPQGRQINWSIHRFGPNGQDLASVAIGPTADLRYVLTVDDVAEQAHYILRMSSSGRFHRLGTHDDQRFIAYAVNPPSEY